MLLAVGATPTTASAQHYLAWADNFVIGAENVSIGQTSCYATVKSCGLFGANYGTNYCNVSYGAYAIAGVQNIATKQNAVARVAYHKRDQSTVDCAVLYVSQTRYRQSSQYATEDYCNTVDGTTYEDWVSISTNTCGWGWSVLWDDTDWAPLQLTHANSSPTSGYNAYLVYLDANRYNASCSPQYVQGTAYTCYEIYWQ